MGIFDSISRGFGSLRSLSNAELEDKREMLRQRYVSSTDTDEASSLYDELHRYDEEMVRRANETYARENPNPPEARHREHGWYLPNDE